MSETVGYPDYQRLSAQAANVLGFIQAQIGSNPFSTIQDAQGFGYINLSINDLGGTGYFTVTVSWYLYDNNNAQLSNFVCTPTPGGEQTLQIPVISRYFQVVVNYVAGTSTDEPLIVWFGANVPAPDAINSQPAAPFFSFSGNIPASGSVTEFATTTIESSAVVMVGSNLGNTWDLAIQYYSLSAKNFVNLTWLYGAQLGQSANVLIGLPPTPIKFVMFNTSTTTTASIFCNCTIA